MARLPRLYAPGAVQYLLQRPATGRSFFFDADDYRFFVDLMASAARAEAVALHAYVLLPGEVRLLATPAGPGSLGRLMQAIGRRYAPYLNRRSGRGGALWNGRYRSTLVDAGALLLAAMRHIERRPVALALADEPGGWPWSSYAHHAGFGQQPFVGDHAGYWALSDAPFARQAAYRDYAAQGDDALDARLEHGVQHGWVVGAPAWEAAMAFVANRRTTPQSAGRRRIVVSPFNEPTSG